MVGRLRAAKKKAIKPTIAITTRPAAATVATGVRHRGAGGTGKADGRECGGVACGSVGAEAGNEDPARRIGAIAASGGGSEAPHRKQLVWPGKLFAWHLGQTMRAAEVMISNDTLSGPPHGQSLPARHEPRRRPSHRQI